MSARANLAVADGEVAPVTHTFVPTGDLSDQVAVYTNSTGVAAGAPEVTTIGVKPSKASVNDKMTLGKEIVPDVTDIRIKYPATYTDLMGNTWINYQDEVIISFRFSPRSTAQRRKNLRKMAYNALADSQTQVVDAIEKASKPY